jgi:hypothetical protein
MPGFRGGLLEKRYLSFYAGVVTMAGVIYNVTTSVADAEVNSWLDWFESIYVREVLKTGTFSQVLLLRVNGREQGGKTFAVQHYADSVDDYERYQQHFHPAITELVQQAFGDSLHTFSTVLDVVGQFSQS